jgi:hypothetical protein
MEWWTPGPAKKLRRGFQQEKIHCLDSNSKKKLLTDFISHAIVPVGTIQIGHLWQNTGLETQQILPPPLQPTGHCVQQRPHTESAVVLLDGYTAPLSTAMPKSNVC